MTMQIQAGTYTVAAGDRGVYETEAGALMFSCECWLDEETSITARQCLVAKDGTLMEKTIVGLKEAFGWDGSDPLWLMDQETLPNFDIVVDFEDYKGVSRPVVKYINPIGTGGGIKKGDRSAIAAKFGAKFRAVATVATSAAPRAPARPAVAAPPAAAKAPAPVPPVAPRPVPAGAGMTMQDAWARVLELAGNDRDKATANWRRETEKIGKPQSEMSNQDWATVVAGCDDIPY
jgi:hypothetical protein